MFENIKRKFKDFGFTRLHRIERFLYHIKNTIKITSKNDKKIANDIEELIQIKMKKVKTVFIFLTICYIGIYFSFISIVLNDFIILSQLSSLINIIVGFFGTTLFIIGTFFFNNMKNLYFQDLELLSSQLIAIYTKYHTQDDVDFYKNNSYKAFIDFYKR